MYLRPAVVDADVLEARGIFPLAAIGAAVMSAGGAVAAGAAAAGAAIGAGAAANAAAGLAGYAVGRKVVNAIKAIPNLKLPSLVRYGGADDDLSPT